VFDIEGTAVRVASGGSPPGKAPTSTSSLVRVTKALRHLIASAEPALVFAHVAAICVPTVCDRCVIDMSEGGASTYRIRRPGGFWSIDDVDESDLGAVPLPWIDRSTIRRRRTGRSATDSASVVPAAIPPAAASPE